MDIVSKKKPTSVTSDLPSALLDLRRQILAMGAIVDARVSCVVDALAKSDLQLARDCRHGDREVDEMEVDIEQRCIEILALQQPVAKDLRFILAVLRVNNELERIGDLAKGIAKRILHLDELGYLSLPSMLTDMARSVRQMLSDVLSALSNNDVTLARQVRRNDQQIDDFQRRILQWGQQEIMEQGATTEAAIDTMNIARAMERIGDMCTNVAEDIIFLVEGEVVRHSKVS
jgi:phosphate transport system protein